MYEQYWTPFASFGPVTVHLPARRIELIGYHESNNDAARPLEPLDGPPTKTLDTRNRDTHPRGAADIVVDPEVEIRSPVTGTVKRAGAYTLYCDHLDYFVVIEPDSQVGWEVKMLHMTGMEVRPGDRVIGGETVIAQGARLLPFESQVDRDTAFPSWPHVHIEIVDPSIPDRPGTGGGC